MNRKKLIVLVVQHQIFKHDYSSPVPYGSGLYPLRIKIEKGK